MAEADPVALMRHLFDGADGNYEVPLMYKARRKAGLVVNLMRVARLVRLRATAGRFRRRSIRTTFPGPDGWKIPDLVRQALRARGAQCGASGNNLRPDQEGLAPFLASLLDP